MKCRWQPMGPQVKQPMEVLNGAGRRCAGLLRASVQAQRHYSNSSNRSLWAVPAKDFWACGSTALERSGPWRKDRHARHLLRCVYRLRYSISAGHCARKNYSRNIFSDNSHVILSLQASEQKFSKNVTRIGVFPTLMYIYGCCLMQCFTYILKMFSLMNKTFASDVFIFS